MEWNLDIQSFKRIYDYEQRKGSNIDKLFHDKTIDSFINLLSPMSGLRSEDSDIREKCFNEFLENIKKIDGDEAWIESIKKNISASNFGKKEFRNIRRFLSKWKGAYIESIMEEFCNTKEVIIKPAEIINGKQVYSIENTARNFIISRVLQQKIKQVYKLNSTSRNIISSQLRNILGDRYPKIVIKADVKAFYESINFDEVIRSMEDDHLMSAQFISLLKSINFQYKQYSGQDKGVPRGIGVSAFVAEYVMRDFDKSIRSMDGLYYYARFVDDIIAIFSTGNGDEEELKESCHKLILEMKKAISDKNLELHTAINDPKRIKPRLFSIYAESIAHKTFEKLEKHTKELETKILVLKKSDPIKNNLYEKIQIVIFNIIKDLTRLSKDEIKDIAEESEKIRSKTVKLFQDSKRVYDNIISLTDISDSSNEPNIVIEKSNIQKCQMGNFIANAKAVINLINTTISAINPKIPYSYAQVEFLGYKYIYSGKDKNGGHHSLIIDIADSKIERQKRKIDAAFKRYFEEKKAGKSSIRRQTRNLFYRIRFLTDSYYLVGYKKNIIVGLIHSYPLVSDECQGFRILNLYLHKIAKKNNIPEWLKKILCSLEFKKWNENTVPVRVSRKSFTEIMKCWRENEKASY